MRSSSIVPLRLLLLLVLAELLVVAGAGAQDETLPVEVELGGLGHEFAYDRAGEILYVSVPSLGEIVAISTVDRIVVGSQPRGIDLSSDGTELFAALNGAGSVAVVDLATDVITRINIGDELDDPRTWDVVEGQPDRLFVSSNPGSNGFAYIVEVLRDSGNAAQRVASNRIIRAAPVFAVEAAERFLYVGEGFSPTPSTSSTWLSRRRPSFSRTTMGASAARTPWKSTPTALASIWAPARCCEPARSSTTTGW